MTDKFTTYPEYTNSIYSELIKSMSIKNSCYCDCHNGLIQHPKCVCTCNVKVITQASGTGYIPTCLICDHKEKEIAELRKRVEKLEEKLKKEIVMRKDLRNYCIDVLAKRINILEDNYESENLD